jgi:methionyl-tRNA synthetase
VWADESLEEGFHPALFRYYMVNGSGLETDVDFSWDRFAERVNGELVGNLGNFCYRSLLFAQRNYEGTPDTDVSDDVRERIEDAIEEFERALREYRVRDVGAVAIDLADFGNEYIQRNEPWKLVDDDPEAAAQVIRDCVQLAKAIAVTMQPVLPGKAEELWAQLDEDGTVHDASLDDALAAPPAAFGEPTELFEGIDDERIDELNGKLQERIAEATESEDADDADTDEDTMDFDPEPLADDRISIDDFQALDIRVGRIEAADPIEGADDLAKLEVDIGVETRQVVAGIKQLHDLDALPGTKVVLLANMEKAELFGVESNGMVLAAGDEADLLTTHEDAPLGSKIR